METSKTKPWVKREQATNFLNNHCSIVVPVAAVMLCVVSHSLPHSTSCTAAPNQAEPSIDARSLETYRTTMLSKFDGRKRMRIWTCCDFRCLRCWNKQSKGWKSPKHFLIISAVSIDVSFKNDLFSLPAIKIYFDWVFVSMVASSFVS
jgi:hypothetical protein